MQRNLIILVGEAVTLNNKAFLGFIAELNLTLELAMKEVPFQKHLQHVLLLLCDSRSQHSNIASQA